MEALTLQIQSVLYNNSKKAISKAIENLANAVRIFRLAGQGFSEIKLVYGDASPHAVFDTIECEEIKQKYKEFFDINIVLFGENTGTAKGHNRLLENCDSDYVMIMNPDVVVNPHIFDQLLAPFTAETDTVGLTEARQTPIEHHKEYNQKTGETSWASTACALFPLSVFREVGGFDHVSFFMYCDDLDFSWRIRLAGYKIIYVPGASVFHSKTLSTDAAWQPTKAELYYSAEAALMLSHKWSNPKRLYSLLNDFGKSADKDYQKIVRDFKQKQEEGSLPQPLDPNHTVASFTKHGYGEYRFIL